MTYYTQGDTPAAPLLVVPARDGEDIDLSLYTAAEAQLTHPDGTAAIIAAVLLDEDDDDGPAVSVQLPTLTQAGLVSISVQLTALGKRDTFDVAPLAVQALDGWHTIGSARGEWTGAKVLDDWRLYVLLHAARRDCITYQPAAGARRPTIEEREAQLLHARNRNAAARIDPASGDDGVNGYSATPFPLDWAVKALLRPARRLGAVR